MKIKEKRNIEITLKQAIEWYNGNDKTLRKLALTAYTEDEMKQSLGYIHSIVSTKALTVVIPTDEGMKHSVLADLTIIARYFNGTWQKTICNTGYFLGDYRGDDPSVVDNYNGIGIYEDNSSVYAGVVYFKKREDVYQAIEILGNNKAKFLF